MTQAKSPRVAIIAIASNECAYLAEWVHHHLSFGFGPIEVTVNRTNDGSRVLLQRMMDRKLPVTFVEGDHLSAVAQSEDLSFQRVAYERSFQRLRSDLDDNDYAFCIDIDEFWTPLDFSSGIQDVLAGLGHPDAVAFSSLDLENDSGLFSSTFRPVMSGWPSQFVKTCFRVGLPVSGVGVHRVFTRKPFDTLIPCGLSLDEKQEQTNGPPEVFAPAFLAHRRFRSLVEYVALVGRGSANWRKMLLKPNRKGYHVPGAAMAPTTRRIPLPEDKVRAHRTSLQDFMKDCSLLGDTKHGRRKVLHGARDTARGALEFPDWQKEFWAHVFTGVDLNEIEALVKSAESELEKIGGQVVIDP